MEWFSTTAADQRGKVAYWNDLVCDTFVEMETRPARTTEFEAELYSDQLGDVRISKAISRPARVVRAPRHVARAQDHKFFLHSLIEGRLLVCQNGVEALLEPGSSILCDSALPYSLEHDAPCSLLVLGIPARTLRRHLPNPELGVGVALAGDKGLGHILSRMLTGVWDQLDDGFPDPIKRRISENLLDVFATAASAASDVIPGNSAIAGTRRVQIKRHIEANLRDPELTARGVAAALRISPRYLHMLFAAEAETVSQYILRRRLEECAKQMSNQAWRGHSITEIAFSWGFNNSTHFARVFREHHGMSPRDFRGRDGDRRH